MSDLVVAKRWDLTESSHDDLKKGIYASGFKKPSKIQERALPMLLMNPWAT